MAKHHYNTQRLCVFTVRHALRSSKLVRCLSRDTDRGRPPPPSSKTKKKESPPNNISTNSFVSYIFHPKPAYLVLFSLKNCKMKLRHPSRIHQLLVFCYHGDTLYAVLLVDHRRTTGGHLLVHLLLYYCRCLPWILYLAFFIGIRGIHDVIIA